jgi:meckelin
VHGSERQLLTRFLFYVSLSYINTCQLDLTPFITQSETIFYDPYLVDLNNQLYPMPVKITNVQIADGATPNRDSQGDEEVDGENLLTRRFYIVDSISGVAVPNARPKVISYLKSAVLRVEMKGGSNTEIRPPLLVLTYGEREVHDILDGGDKQYSTVSFQVQYLKDTSGVWQAAYGLFGTCIVLSLFLVGRRLWVWQRKNGSEVLEVNLFMFVRFMVYLFSSLGDLFFIMICALTFYCWLFYKGQQTVYYLLPALDSDEVRMLRNFIIICFIAKLLDILFKLYNQIKIEIFFMDWEKSRGGDVLASEEEGVSAASGSVSVWRKLFAANKWNDLQSARLINVPFTLFFMIFLMEPSGIGLKYLATAQPNPGNLEASAAPLHPILSFAVTTCFLLVICYLQLLYHKQVTHRYFKDEVAQFVDLLCTSNISALVLDERQHGWYLHGKTVHPHADVSLEEMNAAILSEERTLTRERGLVPGKDSFEMYVTHAWRQNYDELYARLFTKQSLHSARAARSAARGQGVEEVELGRTVSNARGRNADLDRDQPPDTAHLISSALLRANASLNVWLTSFINREPQFPYPYDFGEHESLRQLLGLPVNLSHNAPCTLYDDPDFKFTRVLLCGIEGDLILFLVLLYAFCNILFNSILVATLVCFIVDRSTTHATIEY